jgi:hypothetical protein
MKIKFSNPPTPFKKGAAFKKSLQEFVWMNPPLEKGVGGFKRNNAWLQQDI